MSDVCCISITSMPAPSAWTTPAGMKNMSPGLTSMRLSSSGSVDLATASIYSSRVISGFLKPTYNAAPGLQSTTYHISVLPAESCRSAARVSSGCTCTDNTSLQSRYLTSSGNPIPYLSNIFSPTRSPMYTSTISFRSLPFRNPLATTDTSPLTEESSQLSP